MTHPSKAAAFAALHVPGDPLVLFNIWDAGSARAVASARPRAVATGSASVAGANGFDDGEKVPLDLVIDNARRIVAAVDLPVSIDFEGGYAVDPRQLGANLQRLASTGAVGCNLEDQVIGGSGLHDLVLQCARLRAAREGAGPDFFINARCDLFLQSPPEDHDAAMLDQALERAHAYADAGASGFFAPLLSDLALMERLCRQLPLPVNALVLPNGHSTADWAKAGVARISHGSFPYRAMMTALESSARSALA